MILKSVISFLTFILEGLAKIVMFLLSALGLWIPAVFTLAYVIFCAIVGINFSDALGFFYFGLVLSCLLSLWIAVTQVLKNKKKKAARKPGTENVPSVELKEKPKITASNTGVQGAQNPPPVQQSENQPQPENQPQYNGNQYGAQPYVQPQYDGNQYGGQPYGQPQYNGNQYGGQPYGQPQYNGNQYGGQPYGQPQYNGNQYGGQPYGQPQYNGNQYGGQPYGQTMYERAAQESAGVRFQSYNATNEYSDQSVYGQVPPQTVPSQKQDAPIIYRSKYDPTLIIHEYTDKLVYYRKTGTGYEPDGVEMKPPQE